MMLQKLFLIDLTGSFPEDTRFHEIFDLNKCSYYTVVFIDLLSCIENLCNRHKIYVKEIFFYLFHSLYNFENLEIYCLIYDLLNSLNIFFDSLK